MTLETACTFLRKDRRLEEKQSMTESDQSVCLHIGVNLPEQTTALPVTPSWEPPLPLTHHPTDRFNLQKAALGPGHTLLPFRVKFHEPIERIHTAHILEI